jgi:RNA polymerase sigma-70 factor (ECF subfamily)
MAFDLLGALGCIFSDEPAKEPKATGLLTPTDRKATGVNAHALASSLALLRAHTDGPDAAALTHALEIALTEALRRAVAAHPLLEKHKATFLVRLGEVLMEASHSLDAPISSETVEKVRIADLLLAHAAGKGDTYAITTIERDHVRGAAGGRLRGQRFSSDEVSEIEQTLREHLFVAKPGTLPKIAQYAGKGDLAGWVSVSATRAALRARKKISREVSVDESGILAKQVEHRDLETASTRSASFMACTEPRPPAGWPKSAKTSSIAHAKPSRAERT